jgi:hypothetical protein
MKSCFRRLALLCVLGTSVVNAFSLDREAFTFTYYDLNVQVEPEQQRLGVRGKITLRNDSQSAQKIAVLQISSSLDWRSIKSAGKPLQFVSQPFTSDIDHTGALSEAIVTLPEAVTPKGTIELEIGYEGLVVLDTARLTRIGTPEPAATSSDWDEISTKFTAVRGAGYVAWYPIATEVTNLSEGNSLFEVLGRWKARESGSKVHIQIGTSRDGAEPQPKLLVNNAQCVVLYEAMGGVQHVSADCTYQPLRLDAPTFVIADYQVLDRRAMEVHYLHGHDAVAGNYVDAAEKVVPLISEWFGAPREKARAADLTNPNATPFESGSLLLTPLSAREPNIVGLVAAHQLTHAAFVSPRPWIDEGLAHFAQALYLEHEKGRQSAVDYMGLHRTAFSEAEKLTATPRSEDEVKRALVNTANEELYRSKAMCVWWMVRDMIGEPALKKALASYQGERDKEPSYMPRLIAAQTQRDLQWFFDDWVYHDRGLPDFKVESAFSRKAPTDTYLVTITVANLGGAGAEVPVTTKFAGGEVTKRLEVHGKNKAVIRMEVPHAPEEIVVNDGSVPESDLTNNILKIESAADQSLESQPH